MAPFSRLPAEILLLIVSEIRSNRDLAAFSRSCRSVYNLSRKEMPLRRKCRRIRLKSNSELEKAFALLIAILRQPQLGELVRHLELDRPPTTYHDYEIRNEDLKKLESEDLERLRTAVETAGFAGEYGEKVVNMVLQPYEFGFAYPGLRQEGLRASWVAQALAALLISVCPYLESMSTSILMFNFTAYHRAGFRSTGPFVGERRRFPLERFLVDTNDNPQEKPWLRYLQSVELINDKDSTWDDGRFYEPFDLSGMIQFFDKLPSIEKVGIDAMVEDENGLGYLPPTSSDISRIRIGHSSLGSLYLMHLINSCKTLKEFHYTTGGRASSDGSSFAFNPRTFLKSILRHKNSVEVLDVDADRCCHYIDMEGGPDYDGMIDREEIEDHSGHTDTEIEGFWDQSGSLGDLTSLKHLSIGIVILLCLARGTPSMDTADEFKEFDEVVLADALPPCLESLCIRGYEKGPRPDFDKVIERFLAEKDAKLPNLKTITGIEERIENGCDVEDPDEEDAPLWEREEEDWTEYEF